MNFYEVLCAQSCADAQALVYEKRDSQFPRHNESMQPMRARYDRDAFYVCPCACMRALAVPGCLGRRAVVVGVFGASARSARPRCTCRVTVDFYVAMRCGVSCRCDCNPRRVFSGSHSTARQSVCLFLLWSMLTRWKRCAD